MFFILFWIVSTVYADGAGSSVQLLMSAKNLSDIQVVAEKFEKTALLHDRCMAELKGKYAPIHCYLWISKVDMSERKKSLYLQILDRECADRSSRGAESLRVGEKSLRYLKQVSPACRNSLEQWLAVRVYKLHREDNAQLFQKLESGSVFESIVAHETNEPISKNRIPSPRIPRRRLN